MVFELPILLLVEDMAREKVCKASEHHAFIKETTMIKRLRKKWIYKILQKDSPDGPVVRTCLPMQGMWMWSLLRSLDSTCHRATMPVHSNYRALTFWRPLNTGKRDPVCHEPGAHTLEPACHNPEKSMHHEEEPAFCAKDPACLTKALSSQMNELIQWMKGIF